MPLLLKFSPWAKKGDEANSLSLNAWELLVYLFTCSYRLTPEGSGGPSEAWLFPSAAVFLAVLLPTRASEKPFSSPLCLSLLWVPHKADPTSPNQERPSLHPHLQPLEHDPHPHSSTPWNFGFPLTFPLSSSPPLPENWNIICEIWGADPMAYTNMPSLASVSPWAQNLMALSPGVTPREGCQIQGCWGRQLAGLPFADKKWRHDFPVASPRGFCQSSLGQGAERGDCTSQGLPCGESGRRP